MPNKTLVQIGLGDICDYIYVTVPNWMEFKPVLQATDYPFIPEEIWDGTPWNYHGVDMNVHSISQVSEKYRGLEHTNFIHALVHKHDDEALKHDNFVVNGRGPEVLKSVSLATLFETTGEPDVLVIDTEASELNILSGYDFAHKPEFMVIEIHTFDAFNGILTLMLNQGYSIFEMGGHPQTEEGRLMILSFIRNDLVPERIKDFWCYTENEA